VFKRFFLWALLCGAWLLIFYFHEVRVVNWPMEFSGYPAFRDFANFWAGAVSALHGELGAVFDSKLHDAELGGLLGIPPPPLMWSYPPTALLLMLPVGVLSFPWAIGLWTVAGVCAYLLAAGFRGVSQNDRAPFVAAIALCPGVFMCFAYGQTAFLTSAAFIGGLTEARRRPAFAGLCLALLAAKPQIALVVPIVLVAMGAWRALFATCLFTSLFVGATLIVLGLDAWRLFIDITVPQQFAVLSSPSFRPLVMISPYFFFRELGCAEVVSYALQLLVSVGVATWVFVTIRFERDENIRILMVSSSALLISAYMQSYEVPLLVAAVARICASETSLTKISCNEVTFLVFCVTLGMFAAIVVVFMSGVNLTPLVSLAILAWSSLRAVSNFDAALPSSLSYGQVRLLSKY
jgi:hypothetical protein